MVREGVRAILHQTDSFRVAGDSADPLEVSRRLRMDACEVLLAELSGDGIQVARLAQTVSPAVNIVLMQGGPPPCNTLVAALEMGIEVFVSLDDADDLMRGLRALLAGQSYLSPGWGALLLREMAAKPQWDATLTERESEILSTLVPGRSLADVADRLCLSTSTVKSHLSRIYRKIGVTSRKGASLYARSIGLDSRD